MPQGDKVSYTDKQKRQAEHIEDSEKKRGRSTKAAERIAWATVNKQDGGGKKAGSGRAKRSGRPSRTRTAKRQRPSRKTASRRTGRTAGSRNTRSRA